MFLISLAFAAEDEVCVAYGETTPSIEVEDILVSQSSGLAAGRGTSGAFYTHEDAGGGAVLYVFQEDGTFVGGQTIRNATNTDWEDVAAGPCPDAIDAEHCLWIADIGDNDKVRDAITLWVVAETTQAQEFAVGCPLVYPDSEGHDAEALLVGPDRTIRIVTKSGDGDAKVYRITDPRCDGGDAQTLIEEAEIAFAEPITGGAMNADGTAIVLRSLGNAWLWTGCTLSWSEAPASVDLGSQPQGEAVAFTAAGSLISTSEDSIFRVWTTPCADSTALACPTCGCADGGAGLLLLAPLGGWARRRSRRPR